MTKFAAPRSGVETERSSKAVSSGTAVGPASGDLTGTFPSPTVSKVLGGQTPVSTTTTAGGAQTATVGRTSTIAAPVLRDFVSAKDFGAVGDGTTNDSTAIQNATTAVGTAGKVYLPHGTYLLNSTTPILVPRSATGLVFEGEWHGTNTAGGSTTIKLSANCPQFLRPNKIADYDLFSGISVLNLTVDGANIGGNYHIVLGNWWNNGSINLNRLSWSWIVFSRVTVINVPSNTVSNGNYAFGINCSCSGTETTQCTVTDIYWDHCHVYGAKLGFTALANGNVAAGKIPLFDRIHIVECSHDTLYTPVGSPAGTPSANIDLIGNGIGGFDIFIIVFTGKGSNDVAIEVDGCAGILIIGFDAYNPYNNGFLLTSFQVPVDANGNVLTAEQEHNLRNCRCITQSPSTLVPSAGGFLAEAQNNNPLGHIVYDGCWSIVENITMTVQSTLWSFAAGVNSTQLACHSLTIRSCKVIWDGLTTTSSAGNAYFASISVSAPAGGTAPSVNIEGTNMVYVNATQGGAGALTYRGLCFNSTNCVVEGRGGALSYDYTFTGQSASNTTLCIVGLNTSTVWGELPKVIVRQFSGGDTTPTALNVNGTATLTVAPHRLRAAGWDVKNMPAGTTLVSGATNNAPNTLCHEWLTPTSPVAGQAITVTASTFTYTHGTTAGPTAFNLRASGTVGIFGGTVSSISKNSTQIGAATNMTVPVVPGDTVAVIYTVAPTMNFQAA